jgi:hypothetical protein
MDASAVSDWHQSGYDGDVAVDEHEALASVLVDADW